MRSSGRHLAFTCITICVLLNPRASAGGASISLVSDSAPSLQEVTPPVSPVYDVVVMKPSKGGSETTIVYRDGSLVAENVSCLDLIATAFDIKPDMIAGLPSWADHNRFDLQAKVTDADRMIVAALTSSDRRRMLKEILSEYMHLLTHSETRERSVLLLKPASQAMIMHPSNPSHGNGSISSSIDGQKHEKTIEGHAASLGMLVDELARQLDTTVIDDTGLRGEYDFSLRWSDSLAADPAQEQAPSISAALKEQLGLRLSPGKGPVSVVVVDRISHPGLS